ncbi:MAG: glycosyltransferase family 39 protein [Anaerolineales bacterium]
MNQGRLRRTLVLVGLLVAFALRVYRLGAQSVWWDEGLSIYAARLDFVDATLWTASDVHPPLYFWFLWIWQRLAGEGPFVLRYLTVLHSFLTVAVMVPLGRRLSRTPGVGVAALWLLALSRFHIWWSQELRMYVLAGLCSLLSLYFTLRLIESQPRRRSWLAWALATLGALYTIYAAIVLVLVENLFVFVVGLFRRERLRFWKRWLVAQVGVALVVLPWLALALPRMRSWSSLREPASLDFVLKLNAVLLTQGISADIERHLLPALLVCALLVAGLLLILRRRSEVSAAPPRPGLLLAILGIGVPPLIIWSLTQPRALFYTPQVEARYLLPLAPLFYATLGWSLVGWLRFRRRSLGLLAAAGILASFLGTLPAYYAPRYLRDDFVTLVRLLEEQRRSGDSVVLYTDEVWPVFDAHYGDAWYPIPDGLSPHADEVAARLSEAWDETEGLWLVTTPAAQEMDPHGRVPQWLDERALVSRTWELEENTLTLYARTQARAALLYALAPYFEVPEPLEVQIPSCCTDFSGSLAGYHPPLPRYQTGDTAYLSLYWRRPPDEELLVLLTGPQVRTLLVPPTYANGTTLSAQLVALPLSADLPPGHYRVLIPTAEGDAVEVGRFALQPAEGTLPTASEEAIEHPLDVRLGPSIHLRGYSLPHTSVEAGGSLEVTLYWQTESPLEDRYKVFVHLVGETYNAATDNFLWGQQDNEPVENRLPTTRWAPEVLVADPHTLSVAEDAPPGSYTLQVGLYGLTDGVRLPIFVEGQAEGDSIRLTEIEVR